MTNRKVHVEILSVEGCSGAPPTTELVKSVASDLGIEIVLDETIISTKREAIENRFPGSPTVRVGGVDIEQAAWVEQQFALT